MKRLPLLAGLTLASVLLLSPLAAAGSALPAADADAAGVSVKRLDAMHANLRRFVDEGKYAGYISLLAREGNIVDWRAHGWQDAPARTPLRKDSIVRIYSMSKIVTSVALLALVEDGKVGLNDPVEKFLPALKNRQVLTGGTADAPVYAPADHPLTVKELLTHTAGYYYTDSWSADSPVAIELARRANIWDATDLDDFVRRVAQLPLHEQPGMRFRYGIHTDLVGAVIEKASGQRLSDFVQQRILGPLGMIDTGYWVPAKKRSRLAVVHDRNAQGKLKHAELFPGTDGRPDGGLLSGGGGMFSTAADYGRFAQMLLNGGELDGTRVLARKTVELLTQNHLVALADPHPRAAGGQGFGLGVRVITDLGCNTVPGSVGAFGWDGAATTTVQIDPQERTVAILLTQHFPYNQDDIFGIFATGYYSALEE